MTDNDRDALLAEYDALEDRIEESASEQLWALADWLVAYVPNGGQGGDRNRPRGRLLTTADIAARGRRTERWLQKIRRIADVTQRDRLPDVSVRTYEQALAATGWDVAAANVRLREMGTRLRDQSGPMESVEALQKQIAKRSPEEQRAIIAGAREDSARRKVEAMPARDREHLRRAAAEKDVPLADVVEAVENPDAVEVAADVSRDVASAAARGEAGRLSRERERDRPNVETVTGRDVVASHILADIREATARVRHARERAGSAWLDPAQHRAITRATDALIEQVAAFRSDVAQKEVPAA